MSDLVLSIQGTSAMRGVEAQLEVSSCDHYKNVPQCNGCQTTAELNMCIIISRMDAHH